MLSNKSWGFCVKNIMCGGGWSLLEMSGAVKKMFFSEGKRETSSDLGLLQFKKSFLFLGLLIFYFRLVPAI